ncbi:MAG: type IV toxin-antitoxin system AbiEi family antitoxin domain-containing protein [Gulosibacter sp.]|uniref:type IV toxin-antitoxin system AbiEi family antitoxin domain-containing protein n=1 Tax=Gulosibacter sp. TaxID=2817531 RepID=UPI003F92415C
MSIRELAPAFTLEDARAAGLTKYQVYSLLDRDEIERVGRGVYVRPEMLQPAFTALAAATALREDATLCLTSALVHHDLSDAIPFTSDIALPRGAHQPIGLSNVSWHSFDPVTFPIGREHADAGGGAKVAIYSAERSIVDTFRLMHQEGSDVAYEALRRWLRRRGNTPAGLLKVAGSFPKALPRIRQALEVLL